MRAFAIALCFTLLCAPTAQAQTDEVITPDNLDRLTEVARLGRGIIYDVAWSPDGTTIAAISDNGTWLYDANTPDDLPRALPNSLSGGAIYETNRVEYTSDGRYLYLATQSRIQEWHMNDLSQPFAEYEISGTLSADSRRVLRSSRRTILNKYDIEVWSLDNLHEPLRLLEGHVDYILSSSISADGKRGASSSKDGTVRVWDIDTGETLWVEQVWQPLPPEDWHFRDWQAQISPQGDMLAINACNEDYDTCLKDVTTGETLAK